MIILSIPVKNIDQELSATEFCEHRELRLDYLKEPDSYPISKVSSNAIITIRDCAEGGINQLNISAKIAYYKEVINAANCLVDLEIKNYCSDISSENLILSYHDYSDYYDSSQLIQILKKTDQLNAKYIKIAVKINDYSEFTELTEIIKLSNKPVILVGMGKLGKLSRLLYQHLGSVATYIGLSDQLTASGQLSLIEAKKYKLDMISKRSQIGGLLGGEQVYHSLGMTFYNTLFLQQNLDAFYFPFEIDNFNNFWIWMQSSKINFYGFSITMPHKSEIASRFRLESLLEARNLFIPLANKSYNTDAIAMQKSVEYLGIKNHNLIIILGTGNTAETALFALKDYSNIVIYGRNNLNGKMLANKYNRRFIDSENPANAMDLLINCTSVGLNNEDFFDETGIFPATLIKHQTKIIDLPYAKKITSLISFCLENNLPYVNGESFWQWQAEKQQQEFITEIARNKENNNEL